MTKIIRDSIIPAIYLDMDGVLANFDKAIVEQFDAHFPDVGHDAQERWHLIGQHLPNIYRNLEPMPDAHVLVKGVLERCVEYRFEVGILTALPKYGRMPTAVQDKYQWVVEHFPILALNLGFGPYAVDKQNHANPGDVLIDDSDLNIPQWRAKGGHGILHTSALTSLAELDVILRGQK